MLDGQPIVVIADDDVCMQNIIEDTLSILEPMPRFIRASNIDTLLQLVHMEEVDLITLDINFKGGHVPNREGLDALPRLAQTKPRVPIMMVSGELNIDVVDEAKDDRPQVKGVVDKGAKDFFERLVQVAERAMLWGQEQRHKADAVFVQAEATALAGNAIDAARYYIEAYRTGDLSGGNRQRFKERLDALLPALEAQPELLADAYRVLMEHCFDNNNEIGVIYYARTFMDRFPRYEAEARECLALTAEIGKKNYDMVDERLELAKLHAQNGAFDQVVRECHLIQDKLANVFESYELEADAYKSLGRFRESIEASFVLTDMAIRNAEVPRAVEVLETITHMDKEEVFKHRVDTEHTFIRRIRERIADIETLKAIPLLVICGDPDCRREAEFGQGFFRVDTARPMSECDICGVVYEQAPRDLAGKTITIVGGRFGEKYRQAIKRLGAKEVLHHDAIHEVHRIPALISPADAVLIVTGYASHAGTIKANRVLTASPRPHGHVHFYGVKQVVRGVLLELVPQMAKFATPA